jgi:hypothetical protein
VFLFSYVTEQATEWECEVIARRGLKGTRVEEVFANPEDATAQTLAQMEARFDRLLVHYDVDTVDFTTSRSRRTRGATRDSPLR